MYELQYKTWYTSPRPPALTPPPPLLAQQWTLLAQVLIFALQTWYKRTSKEWSDLEEEFCAKQYLLTILYCREIFAVLEKLHLTPFIGQLERGLESEVRIMHSVADQKIRLIFVTRHNFINCRNNMLDYACRLHISSNSSFNTAEYIHPAITPELIFSSRAETLPVHSFKLLGQNNQCLSKQLYTHLTSQCCS